MSLDFLAFNDKLDSALWIPRESEAEYSIDTVKADFKNASFETTPEKLNYSHSLNSVVFYKDINDSWTEIKYPKNSLFQNYSINKFLNFNMVCDISKKDIAYFFK